MSLASTGNEGTMLMTPPTEDRVQVKGYLWLSSALVLRCKN